jgi:Possible lysine decarboxylase
VKCVCVFSGSSPGADLAYRAAASDLGHRLAERGIELVFGGASVGLMGAVADAAIEGGGHVIGVIPQSLVDREVAHQGLGDLRVVHSMHERKAVMAELADAFVASAAGWGGDARGAVRGASSRPSTGRRCSCRRTSASCSTASRAGRRPRSRSGSIGRRANL